MKQKERANETCYSSVRPAAPPSKVNLFYYQKDEIICLQFYDESAKKDNEKDEKDKPIPRKGSQALKP